MTKSDYRAKAKQEREYPYSEKALLKALRECQEFQSLKIILSYRPIKGEIDLTILEAIYPEKTFLYPVVKGDNMIFTLSDTYKKNKWGIEEPLNENEYIFEKALIITPGLFFDLKKYRLGRGKGFYDRYLKAHRTKLFSIGICKKNQLTETLPVDDFDQKLDKLIILSESEEDENYESLT